MKYRIVEYTAHNRPSEYEIQEYTWLFGWRKCPKSFLQYDKDAAEKWLDTYISVKQTVIKEIDTDKK